MQIFRKLSEKVSAALSAWAAEVVPAAEPAVKRERPWQGDLWSGHQTRVYRAAEALLKAWADRSETGMAPRPTRQGARLSDGTTYVVYTDGSFRNVDETRRPADLSGRQRVLGRKQLRRLRKAHALRVVTQEAAAPTSVGG